MEDIRNRLASIALRRENEHTVKLPPKTITRVAVTLSALQRQMYDQLKNELAIWIRNLSGEDVLAQADNILTRLIRLALLASNPALLDRKYVEKPAKFEALDRLLPLYLADASNKVIVWTSFVEHIPALIARFASWRPVAIYGDMNGAARDRSVTAFKNDPSVRIMVANPAAAREGLTLTQARTAVYLDRTFNLVDFVQSQDRIHRLSQKYPCEIVLLLAENTIDEFIDFSLA